jgi:hypothetical protein
VSEEEEEEESRRLTERQSGGARGHHAVLLHLAATGGLADLQTEVQIAVLTEADLCADVKILPRNADILLFRGWIRLTLFLVRRRCNGKIARGLLLTDWIGTFKFIGIE